MVTHNELVPRYFGIKLFLLCSAATLALAAFFLFPAIILCGLTHDEVPWGKYAAFWIVFDTVLFVTSLGLEIIERRILPLLRPRRRHGTTQLES